MTNYSYPVCPICGQWIVQGFHDCIDPCPYRQPWKKREHRPTLEEIRQIVREELAKALQQIQFEVKPWKPPV